MSKESQKSIDKEAEIFIDNLVEFISDCDDLSNEAIDKELEQKGIAISELIVSVQHMVDDALEKDRLSWQEEAVKSRESNLQKFAGKAKNIVTVGRKELIDRLNAIVKKEDPDFIFAHRNLKLEELSEEELRDILTEYDQLNED